MTQKQSQADHPDYLTCMDGGGRAIESMEIGRPSPERMRAASEVGSAIAHQLNGPLTALRLYIGEIRQGSRRSGTLQEDGMQEMVEAAFQETERACAIMRLIADSFEGPLYPETAAALGRDVISWWSRSSGADGTGHAGTRTAEEAATFGLLTPREREVLDHISQGCSNKQGAAQMKIGPRTFESHRARVMRKLGARNAADLVRIALLKPNVG
jgi:DNA-binding CsgD family transcriptional regulator